MNIQITDIFRFFFTFSALNIINPFAYFMKVNRMILLKGSDFFDLKTEFISMTVYAIAALSLAVWKYRKVA